MHRSLLAIGALTALFGAALTSPASAHMMCGPGQQAQASSTQSQGGGMMCGMMGRQAQDAPMAEKPTKPQQRTGMCPCCRNMAMMGGGMTGGQQHNPQHHMPGMQMPQQ
jgi:hypothetical protein